MAESNLLFWLWRPGIGGVRREERDPSAPSPGRPRLPRASGQQPEPEPRGSPGCGERSSCCALGQQLPGRLRSQGAAADQLRPAGQRLPAPPRPPGTRARAPAPGGGEGGSGAPGWGAPAPLASSPQPGLRAAGRAPGYSPVAEEGFRGMGPLALPLLPECPLPRMDRAATGPAAVKVLCEPQPPPSPPLPGRGVVSLTQEEPLKQPPPF